MSGLDGLQLVGARLDAIRHLCEHYRHGEAEATHDDGWTDRQWLAQTVLNILDGAIDDQLTRTETT